MTQLLAEADEAEAFRQETGKTHPRFGTGSLMSAAARHPRGSEPGFDCPEDRAAWRMVIDGDGGMQGQEQP